MSTPLTPDKEDVDITVRQRHSDTQYDEVTQPGHGRRPQDVSDGGPGLHEKNPSSGALITPNSDDDDAIEITVMGNNKHIEELKEEIQRTHRENQEFKQQVSVQIKNAFDQHNANPQDDVIVPNGGEGKWAGLRTCTKTFLTFAILLALIAILINLMGAQDAPQTVPATAQPEEVWPQLTQFNNNDIIDFDVGGTTGQTKIRYGLLLQVPESKMYEKFIKKQSKQKKGTVFVDRPLQAFKNVLNFLRNGLVMPTLQDGYDTKMFKLELKFWGLPSRKPTPFEYDLIQIFKSVPTGDMVSKDVLVQWKKLLPFNLLDVVDDNSVVIDETDAVAALVAPDIYEWNGQTSSGAAEGFGRIIGDFGIFEGQCAGGVVDGYGRLIWNNRNSFVGQFQAGQITGKGSYYYAYTNKTFVGTWAKGVMTQSSDPEDGLKGFVIDMPMPYPIKDPEDQTVSKISNLLKNKPELSYLSKGASAKDISDFQKVQDKWQNSKKMNLKELESIGLIKIDKKLPVTTIKSDNFIYDGQVSTANKASRRNLKEAAAQASQQVSQGFGRQYGLFGVYEGEFNQGKIHGYGRMIMKNLDIYQGEFADGFYNGVGKLMLDTGKILQGTWKAGVLETSLKNDNSAGYVAPKPDVPSVLRVKSALELYLDTIYSTMPKGTSNTVINKWVALGPYDISGLVANRSISLETYESYGQEKDVSGIYEGQTFANATIWSSLTSQYTNTNKVVQALGYGRIVRPSYMYEGTFGTNATNMIRTSIRNDSCLWNSGRDCAKKLPGRIIWNDNNLRNNKTLKIKLEDQLLDDVQGYVIQTPLIQRLTQLYSSQKSVELANLLSKFPGYFDFKTLWVTQIINIDPSVKVTIINDNNFGQLNAAGKREGLGRLLNQTCLYEGQFSNDVPHGLGRLVQISNASNNFIGIIDGYFQNDQYGAVNQSWYEAQNVFNNAPLPANEFSTSANASQYEIQKANALFNKQWSMHGEYNLQNIADIFQSATFFPDNAIGDNYASLGVTSKQSISGSLIQNRTGLLNYIDPFWQEGTNNILSSQPDAIYREIVKDVNGTIQNITESTSAVTRTFGPKLSIQPFPNLATFNGDYYWIYRWDRAQRAINYSALNKGLQMRLNYKEGLLNDILVYDDGKIILNNQDAGMETKEGLSFKYFAPNQGKMYLLYYQPPSMQDWWAAKAWKKIGVYDVVVFNSWTGQMEKLSRENPPTNRSNPTAQYIQVDCQNNNITTISGKDWTYTGQVQWFGSNSMLVAQGLGRYQSQKCFYEGQFEQGKPDFNGRVLVRDGNSDKGTLTQERQYMRTRGGDDSKSYNQVYDKTEACMISYGLIQRKVSSDLDRLQKQILNQTWIEPGPASLVYTTLTYSISYNLYDMPGFQEIKQLSSFYPLAIVTDQFSYFGQIKNDTTGEGFGMVKNSQGIWKGYQNSSQSIQVGKVWFTNGDVYEGYYENWKFSGQGKLSLASNGLSYEGIWKDNALKNGKMPYEKGFTYKNTWAPVFSRKTYELEDYLVKNIFKSPLQNIIPSDPLGLIEKAVLKNPYKLSQLVSTFNGTQWLSQDQKMINSREQDYFGQPNQVQWTAFDYFKQSPQGRIFLNDSLYEGTVMNGTANGQGRFTFLNKDGNVQMFNGYWNNGSSRLTYRDIDQDWDQTSQSYYLYDSIYASYDQYTLRSLTKGSNHVGKIQTNYFPELQWKIIDLFNSIPKSSSMAQADFDKLPNYKYFSDKDSLLNEKYFIQGSIYNYCNLTSFEGICSSNITAKATNVSKSIVNNSTAPSPATIITTTSSSATIPVLGRTTTKTFYHDGQLTNGSFNGFGQLYSYSNKTYFSGNFVNGTKEGIGESFQNGQIVKGLWYNSIFIGNSTSVLNQYKLYEIFSTKPDLKANDQKWQNSLQTFNKFWDLHVKGIFIVKEINATSGFIDQKYWNKKFQNSIILKNQQYNQSFGGNTQISCTAGLQQQGQDCWYQCNELPGSCSYCGTGKCCRLLSQGGDCLPNEGSTSAKHSCVPQTCNNILYGVSGQNGTNLQRISYVKTNNANTDFEICLLEGQLGNIIYSQNMSIPDGQFGVQMCSKTTGSYKSDVKWNTTTIVKIGYFLDGLLRNGTKYSYGLKNNTVQTGMFLMNESAYLTYNEFALKRIFESTPPKQFASDWKKFGDITRQEYFIDKFDLKPYFEKIKTKKKDNAPFCNVNIDQNGPYSYENGCGWCDYINQCEQKDYCKKCCTNNGDASKYNQCREQKPQSKEVIQTQNNPSGFYGFQLNDAQNKAAFQNKTDLQGLLIDNTQISYARIIIKANISTDLNTYQLLDTLIEGDLKSEYIRQIVPGKYIYVGQYNIYKPYGNGTYYYSNGTNSTVFTDPNSNQYASYGAYLFFNSDNNKWSITQPNNFTSIYNKTYLSGIEGQINDLAKKAGIEIQNLNYYSKFTSQNKQMSSIFLSNKQMKVFEDKPVHQYLRISYSNDSVLLVASDVKNTTQVQYIQYNAYQFAQNISYIQGSQGLTTHGLGNVTILFFNGTSQQMYFKGGLFYINKYQSDLQDVFSNQTFKPYPLSNYPLNTYPLNFTKVMKAVGEYQVNMSGLDQTAIIVLRNITTTSMWYGQQSSLKSIRIGKVMNYGPNGRILMSIEEGQFINYTLNGKGRKITQDSYFVGTFKNGVKNGQGVMTFIGNGTTVSGIWLNDKFTQDCIDQLAAAAKYPVSSVFAFSQSAQKTSTFNAKSYFLNKNVDKCPITQCQVMDQTCQILSKIAKVDSTDSNISILPMTNVTKGYINETVCIICKNKHDSALVLVNFTQSSCKSTNSCPFSTCAGSLQKINETKEISFNYTQFNVPQIVQKRAEDFYTNKWTQQCPITQCKLMDNDCDEPFLGGFITIDQRNQINVITDFINGWKQQVCIVCSTQTDTVQNQIVINQLPCNVTGNCPPNNSTERQQGTGECIGFLDHKEFNLAPNISFPYTILEKPQVSKSLATDFFVNQNSTKCPITRCTMMDNDCDEPYVNGIEISLVAPFNIIARTDYLFGRVEPVCIVCENIDERVGIEITIDQLPCNSSGNCPDNSTIRQEGTGACAGFLDHLDFPKKIEFKFNPDMIPQQANVSAKSFFENRDNLKCPIIGCQMMGSDCQNPYLDGISVDNSEPFGISAVTNYVLGWQDQVCLICENVDQRVAIEIQIDQIPCNVTNNCPAHGGTGLEPGSGSCKGFLDHVRVPQQITFPFGQQDQLEFAYSDINAIDFFLNKNGSLCPIISCEMMDNDCDEPFADGIEIDNYGSFNIKSKTNFPNGRISNVCVVCENIDERVGIEITIDQTPSPNSNSTTAGQCAGFLDHVDNPKKVEFSFVESNVLQISDVDAVSYFINQNASKCPIIGCQIMGPDCISPYLDGISVVKQAPWKINAVSNYVQGWQDPVCIVCENADERVGIEIQIDQLACTATNNCPNNDTAVEVDQSCRGFLDHVNKPKKIEFGFVLSENPQVSDIDATEFFTNKNSTKCPITKCTMHGPDCEAPYLDGIDISSSAPWKINAVSNYVLGWKDPVCIVCENKDEIVGLPMVIDQLSCNSSNNCPENEEAEETLQSCLGQLTKISNPKRIQFNFISSETPQVSNIVATEFFNVNNNTRCPITSCQMMGRDCLQPYNDGIEIDKTPPFKINAISNYVLGWSDPICIVCRNKDEQSDFQMTIDQLSCNAANSCPKEESHSEESDCRGQLTRVDNPKKVEFNFVSLESPQVSNIVATEFFNNKDSTKCPILSCQMMGSDCQAPYLDGLIIQNIAPFKINAISNFITGWQDPICIMCSNKDESSTVQMTIDQLPCNATNNCPQEEAHEEEEQDCRGQLTRVQNPKQITFNFVSSETPQYIDIVATDFFNVKDSTKCPILSCQMMGSDCQAVYVDGISIDNSSPWKINAVSNYLTGWQDPVCIVCQNKNEKTGFQMTIDQLSCNATNSCPKVNTTEVHTGVCRDKLDHVQNPSDILFPYSNSTVPQVWSSNAEYYFINSDQDGCPITKCFLLDENCRDPFSADGNITINDKSPFQVSALTNNSAGYNYAVCLECENQDQKVGVEIHIVQIGKQPAGIR